MATLKEKAQQILAEKQAKIIPTNIKEEVQIFDITGSYEGQPIDNQDKTIIENGEYTADEGYTGLGTVTVNVPTAEDLDTELDEQDDLIEDIKEALNGKKRK